MATILIVDDSPAEQQQLAESLKKHGYKVITADNGADGIALCFDEKPDAVLIAIVTPEINGFQVTRQLTINKNTQHIPVVIVSKQWQDSDRSWGLQQGARGFLTKPVKESALLQTLEKILEKTPA